jgi:hypothetical protein|uniref:Baseplate protein n=1 Tax=Myoviridae sp. ctshb19 TaxID=2825194 RepID=A0A8S5UGS1_9CAUD|nr:MAG TPA: baseplate protein [Myoviridae sp. ctshb19]
MQFDNTNLPSRLIPYAVKTINAQPFRPMHLPYLSEAILTKNDAPLIEAVGQVIDFDVNQLTDGDFYYILTWLRFASRSLPIYAEWDCEGVVFTREGDESGKIYTIAEIDSMHEQWDAAKDTEAQAHMENPFEIVFIEQDCDHHNKQLAKFEDFKVKFIDESPLDPELDYPRVRDLVAYKELGSDVRNQIVIGPVRYLKEGRTLHERLHSLEKVEMELFDKAAFAHFTYDHGVLQRIYKKCEKCGTDHPFDVSIDAASFFV